MASETELLVLPSVYRGPSRALRLRRAMRRYPVASAAAFVILAFIIIAVFAGVLAPYDPAKTEGAKRLADPSLSHPFGLDGLGRDVLSRVIYGSRVSLRVGLVAVFFAAGIGIPLGLISGYFGGWIDSVIMRSVDAVIAFPHLVLALTLVLVLGPSEINIMAAVGISSSPTYARLVRSQVLSLRSRDFVLAARAMGANDRQIIWKHVWPNTIPSVIVAASLTMGSAILAEAALSFLGVGVRPPTPTWGRMLNESFGFIYVQPWLSFFPGLAIFLLTLSFNLLGDGLRDALDPRLRGQA